MGYAGRQSWAHLFLPMDYFGTGYAGRQSWARFISGFILAWVTQVDSPGPDLFLDLFWIYFGTGYAGRQSWARFISEFILDLFWHGLRR
jgi:hypothetical protein